MTEDDIIEFKKMNTSVAEDIAETVRKFLNHNVNEESLEKSKEAQAQVKGRGFAARDFRMNFICLLDPRKIDTHNF